MNTINRKQTGFTLIELVVVIVILGILAAVALPKYVSLENEAHAAVAKGVAASFSGASVMNYAQKRAQGVTTYAPTCSAATDIQGGVLPSGCTVAAPSGTCTGGADSCVVTCTGQTATASLLCYP